MERRELEERIAELGPWHYRFEFDDGVVTPIATPVNVNRHEQRRRYFFDALLRVMGGSLKGHRVLDLGCNAGFWASQAMAADADFLLGVDGRQGQLDQASPSSRPRASTRPATASNRGTSSSTTSPKSSTW